MSNPEIEIKIMLDMIGFLKNRIKELREKERQRERNNITVESLLSELEIPKECFLIKDASTGKLWSIPPYLVLQPEFQTIK